MNTTVPDNALPDGLWQLRIAAPSSFLDLRELLLDDAVAISSMRQNDDNETWLFEALMAKEPAVALLEAGIALLAQVRSVVTPRVEVFFLEARDWFALNQTSLSVFDTGPFRIIPIHHALSVRPDHRWSLVLSAGLAFDSGTHETTQACLLLMTSLSCRVSPSPTAYSRRMGEPLAAARLSEDIGTKTIAIKAPPGSPMPRLPKAIGRASHRSVIAFRPKSAGRVRECRAQRHDDIGVADSVVRNVSVDVS
ncbi:MAG: 50S ribosomal protein L11 methyltransferase [Rhodospirillaceae bacterium]|nr:50S ribosomal protein L11 methyltransferase [Rhodospirillaceae bacterium]